MRFLKIAFFASAVFLYFCLFFHNIIEFDQDLGRHLLLGKIIWQTHHVPLINLFSYTYPNFPFYNMHWLSEVIFFLVAKISIPSLIYLKVLVLIIAFSLTLLTSLKYSRNLIATAVAFAIFVPVLLERTEIRPEIFSYLFTAIFIYLLSRSSRLVWILPLIEIFWVNMHIYFFLGPVLVAIFVTEKIWRNFKSSRGAVLLLILTSLATLFNPSGFLGATYPLWVFQNYGYAIEENQTVFFLQNIISNPNIIFFEVGLVIFLASFLLVDFRKINLTHILLAGLIILPLQAIRSLPFFFLLEVPIIAFNFAHLNPVVVKERFATKRWLGPAIIIFIIVLTNWRAVRLMTNDYYLSTDSHKRFGTEIADSGKGAVDFVLKNNLHGPIFNNFDIGGYLDYRLYPDQRVFVDNRPGEFPKEFFQNVYIPMQQSPDNFKTVDGIYKFNLIIFSHTDNTPWAQQFLRDIVKNQEFKLVYLDSYAAVFVKNQTYPAISSKLEVKPTNSYLGDLSLAQAFSNFGRDNLAVQLIQKAYSQRPSSPAALFAMGTLYSGSPTTSFLGQKYLQEYHQKADLVIF